MTRWGAVWVVIAGTLASCAGQPARSDDPLTDLQDPKLSLQRRIEALDMAWSRAGASDRDEARDALKAVAWSTQTPLPLRLAALRKLVNDPASEPDARTTARLMLPLEPNLDVVELLGDAAAAHGWTELSPALVRSYARPGNGPDSERPERRALLALNPGLTIEAVVFGVFMHPAPAGIQSARATDQGIDYVQRARAAAWDLLGRLDPDGEARAPLLETEHASGDGQDAALSDLHACLRDLHTVPVSGDELTWLQSLRDPSHTANIAWWAESTSAIAKLTPEQARNLRLRHAEPVRWAAANRLDWLGADRAALLAELSARLRDRPVHQRQVRADLSKRPRTERLPESEGELAWGDILSMLVLDEALHDPGVIAQLFEQTRTDHADRTTEYGGLLFLQPPAFRAASYPPRPSQRLGDDQFVASPDMLTQGDLAAAHYHFHVTEIFNSSFSGPSGGDLAYAARYGRACIVFTSLSQGVLSADYYQPDGVTIDLGELRESRP